MGDAVKATENPQKKSFFKGLKSEFKKIVWPDKKTLTKETTAVVVISVISAYENRHKNHKSKKGKCVHILRHKYTYNEEKHKQKLSSGI